jgi:hypothetical protein
MANPFASADDVAARWRVLTPAEQELADTLASDASMLIRARYSDVDARVATGSLDEDVLTAVVAGMVRRAMIGAAAGDGVTQSSETVGPFSHSQSYANPMGNLFLTATDDVLIRGYRPRAVSMRLGY